MNDGPLIESADAVDFDFTQRSAENTPIRPRKRTAEDTPQPSSTKRPRLLLSYRKRAKEFRVLDNVHGFIRVGGLCKEILDTSEFQRLRDIFQLGACSRVYPGAVHSRFNHSIGVMHLAEELIRKVKRKQSLLLQDVTEEDILCAKVAGLCHDLGHGPFSHAFDSVFLPLVGASKDWSHEEMSCRMLRHLIKGNSINLDDYFGHGQGEPALLRIEDCIMGPKPEHRKSRGEHEWTGPKEFLYHVVNNARSGLDVDKCDYFLRDNQMAGLKITSGWDLPRMFQEGRVFKAQPVEGYDAPDTTPYQLCFHMASVPNVIRFFSTRVDLHRTLYQHKTVKAVERMISDILCLANDHLFFRGKDEDGNDVMRKMSEAINDLSAFSLLRDSVLDLIRVSTLPELEPARQLLEQLERREVYKCLGMTDVPKKYGAAGGQLQDIAEAIETDIMRHVRRITQEAAVQDGEVDDSHVTLSDTQSLPENLPGKKNLIVTFRVLHHGRGEDNPTERVRFYDQEHKSHRLADTSVVARRFRESDFKLYLPQQFQQVKVCVYVRRAELAPLFKKAFEAWAREAKVEETVEYVHTQRLQSPLFGVPNGAGSSIREGDESDGADEESGADGDHMDGSGEGADNGAQEGEGDDGGETEQEE